VVCRIKRERHAELLVMFAPDANVLADMMDTLNVFSVSRLNATKSVIGSQALANFSIFLT